MRTFAVLLGTIIAATNAAYAAGDSTCAHCGAHTCCRKVWRPELEEKKVEVQCWGCKCEEFAVPGPSCQGCRQCETVCETCGKKNNAKVCSEPKRFTWTDWLPTFAQSYCRTKLMRRTETVKVPSYKWVQEDLCPACAAASLKHPQSDGGEDAQLVENTINGEFAITNTQSPPK